MPMRLRDLRNRGSMPMEAHRVGKVWWGSWMEEDDGGGAPPPASLSSSSVMLYIRNGMEYVWIGDGWDNTVCTVSPRKFVICTLCCFVAFCWLRCRQVLFFPVCLSGVRPKKGAAAMSS